MTTTSTSKRILSVDILRGIIMIVMALDHTRDFFSGYRFDPLDFQHTTTTLFLTRWITHFCAPVFVFLSGTSAFLSLQRGKTRKQASLQLLTRGIWLIILELTIVRLGWAFNFDYRMIFVQVIWAIGWSMIFLAALVFLPRPVILAIGLLMIFGHNTLDGIQASQFGHYAFLWDILHQQAPVQYGNHDTFFVLYPLIPWMGVMATGYCFGSLLLKPENERNKWLYGIGISAILLFIIIRSTNLYGDPLPWQYQDTTWFTILSFINCTKYPPSLLYLLMTLGPSIASMPILEKLTGAACKFFIVYGRVPLFYYILHIYLIHILAVITGLIKSLPLSYFTNNNMLSIRNGQWGFSLPIVYLYWISVVLLLYYPSRWFMRIKMDHKKWWLSYL